VHREAMLSLAMLLSRQKKHAEAIEVARKLRRRTRDVELMIFLAGQLEGAKRYDEALVVITEATEKAPENPAAWFSLGVIQDKLGKLDQVVAAMEKVIALDPKHATALNYLGYTFADRNMRLPEAETLVLRALEIRPDDGYFLDSLAWVHYRRGDYRRAEEELLRALKLVPDDPVILEHLGMSCRPREGTRRRPSGSRRRSRKAREAGRSEGEAPPPAQGGARREVRFRGAKPLRGVAPLLAVLALCGCAPSRTIVTGPEADLAERFFAGLPGRVVFPSRRRFPGSRCPSPERRPLRGGDLRAVAGRRDGGPVRSPRSRGGVSGE